jgi:hypothetical protein
MKKNSIKFDDLYREVGEIGSYQIIIIILISFITIIPAITSFQEVFIGATPEYRLFFIFREQNFFNNHFYSLQKKTDVKYQIIQMILSKS